MIDVELASCITNSPLLGRQRKRERETERERWRERHREGLKESKREGEGEKEDEERSSIQLIKVEDSGISLRRRFLSSTPPSPPSLPVSLLTHPLPISHFIFCGEDGRGGSIKGLF